jgi:hypothetical protein
VRPVVFQGRNREEHQGGPVHFRAQLGRPEHLVPDFSHFHTFVPRLQAPVRAFLVRASDAAASPVGQYSRPKYPE